MRHLLLRISFLMVVFWGLHANVDANQTMRKSLYENTLDLRCGSIPDHSKTLTENKMFISFYNPNDYPIMLNNYFFIEDVVGYAMPEFSEKYLNVLIGPKRGFRMNCDTIREILFPGANFSSEISSNFQGLVYSRSIRSLDVIFEHMAMSTDSDLIWND